MNQINFTKFSMHQRHLGSCLTSPLTQNLANERNAALILESISISERQRSPDEGGLAVQAEPLHVRTINAILVACVALCVTFVNSNMTGESAESDEFVSVAKSWLRSLLLGLKVISSSQPMSWSLMPRAINPYKGTRTKVFGCVQSTCA